MTILHLIMDEVVNEFNRNIIRKGIILKMIRVKYIYKVSLMMFVGDTALVGHSEAKVTGNTQT